MWVVRPLVESSEVREQEYLSTQFSLIHNRYLSPAQLDEESTGGRFASHGKVSSNTSNFKASFSFMDTSGDDRGLAKSRGYSVRGLPPIKNTNTLANVEKRMSENSTQKDVNKKPSAVLPSFTTAEHNEDRERRRSSTSNILTEDLEL